MAYIHAMDDDTPRKSCQLFYIDSPADDHTDSRKSEKDE